MNTTSLDGMAFAAAAWLATYLMHSTLWLASAWLLVRVVRSPALGEWIWRAALVGGLVTASLYGRIGGLEPAAMLRAVQPAAAGPVIALEPPAKELARISPATGAVEVTTPRSAPVEPTAPPPALRWYQAVAGLWLLGAALALAHLAHLRRRLRRALAGRRPVAGGPLARALERVHAAAGSARAVRLTTSRRLASPVALAGDEICVPERAAAELGARELEALLAHELAHLERRDPAWLRAISTLERVLFPQPLNRLAARRLEDAAEVLCDERAVHWTGAGVALARCLHEVATWRGVAARGASAMVRPASALVDRVRRVLEDSANAPTGGQRAAVAAWALAGIALLACQGPGVSAEREPAAEPAPPQATEFTLLIPLNAGVDPEASWPELEREVEGMVAANRAANGGSFSPAAFQASWDHLAAVRGEPTGDGTALRAVVRISDAGVEWVERTVQGVTFGILTSDGAGEPREVEVAPRLKALGWMGDAGEGEHSTLEVRADGSVDATLVIPDPRQPGVELATGTRVEAGVDFPERIHAWLARAAAQMPREPGGEGDETYPSDLVVLKVHEGAGFGAVLEILRACAAADVGLWNLAFEIDGPDGPLLLEAPLPRDVPAQPAAGAARVQLEIEVQQEGARVQLDSGAPWSGQGPFRFEGRAVTYSIRQVAAGGQNTAMGGYASDPAEALRLLEQMKQTQPELVLTIDARPGVVYGDLAPVVAGAREAGIPVRFARGD